MADKKPNPIEKAIGARAKTKEDLRERTKTQADLGQIPLSNSLPSDVADVPSPSEMLDLEELNRQTEERFREPDGIKFPQEPIAAQPMPVKTAEPSIPVSKPAPQPGKKTCSEGSPPQTEIPGGVRDSDLDAVIKEDAKILSPLNTENAIGALDDLVKKEVPDVGGVMTDNHQEHVKAFKQFREEFNRDRKTLAAEEPALRALRDFVFGESFVPSGVAIHIVSLCSQPMTTPSTTNWDFADRASIPDMVFSLLRQPGYLEGIWPSLKVVMSDNIGNPAWSAGIATTLAFFDMIRTLPMVKEMSYEVEEKS